MKKKVKFDRNSAERYYPNPQEGLNNEQIEERKLHHLVNEPVKNKDTIFSIVLKNFLTFFNIMYLVIFVIMVVAKLQITNFLFVIVVLFNLLIGTIQEIRSKIMIDKLSLLSTKDITAIRNGEDVKIKSSDILLDEIFKLNAGDELSTDSILISGEVEVSEAQLTGESVSIHKTVGQMVYSGSVVVSGHGIFQAERVGEDTEMQKLSAQAKKFKKPKSEIFNSLNFILRIIAVIIIPLGLLIFYLTYNNLGDSLNEAYRLQYSIEKTCGAVLGMIPSGLYLMTSMSLAVSVVKLGKKKTLVHNIYCIEMLARADVLCLDKTGTITDGSMRVMNVIEQCKHNEFDVNGIISSMNYALNEQNFTAKALNDYFGSYERFDAVEKLDFNSTNKYSAVTLRKLGTFVIGAPEFVLQKGYSKYEELVNDFANKGLRVLCLGVTEGISKGKISKAAKCIAFILIEDQIRPDAIETINNFKENGVEVKIISGDNPLTVAEVAKRVGVANADMAISLEGLSEEEVIEAANKYTVFGRVNPEQKKLIVQTLRKNKHTVAMTGDGVNDILALKEADCSIAMNSGCEAVKNISHLVLLDSDFSSMPSIVGEGRRVINNVQQTSMLYLTKTLFIIILALLFVSGFIKAFGPDGGNVSFPISPSQLTLIEIFAIGIPGFFLTLQSNFSPIKGHFVSNVLKRSLPGAFAVTTEIILTYLFSKRLGLSNMEVTSIIVIVSTTTCMMVLYIACRPMTLKKSILYFLMCFFCIFITISSMNGRSFLGFNYQEQFKIYNLSHDYNNKPITVELEELPGSKMEKIEEMFLDTESGEEYSVYKIEYQKPNEDVMKKIYENNIDNSDDSSGILVLFGNGSLNTAYAASIDLEGTNNFFIPRLNEEDLIYIEGLSYTDEFPGSEDHDTITVYFVNNQQWNDSKIFSLLHYEQRTNVIDSTSLLLSIALSEASYIILVFFGVFFDFLTDKKRKRELKERFLEFNDFKK